MNLIALGLETEIHFLKFSQHLLIWEKQKASQDSSAANIPQEADT